MSPLSHKQKEPPIKYFLPLVVLACTGLAGCDDGPANCCSVAVIGGTDGMAHAGPALEATATQFLGPSSSASEDTSSAGPSESTRADGFPRLPLGRDTLSPDSSTAHRRLSDHRLGLRVQTDLPLSARTKAFAALSLSGGQSRHLLPQGLGPLADPMQIGFDRLSVTPEVGIRWGRPLPEVAGAQTGLTLALSAGQEVSRVRTTLRSALLDITNYSTVRLSFVSLGAGVMLAPVGGGPQIEAVVQARQMSGGDRVLHSEIRLSR